MRPKVMHEPSRRPSRDLKRQLEALAALIDRAARGLELTEEPSGFIAVLEAEPEAQGAP